jgi:hypothetical protein
VNLKRLKLSDADADNTLTHVTSTLDLENNMLRDGTDIKGKKIVTFSNILNHKAFPLADILLQVLFIAQKEISNPIEIEFAVNLNINCGQPSVFNLLQIRPIVINRETVDIDIKSVPKEQTIISSVSALGNGVIDNICDIIYIKPETFNAANNHSLAEKIGNINQSLVKENRNDILIGPGRWGSSDPWLGVPVKWAHVSAARVIIESGLENYHIDPSQGTHFFHNITTFRVGYFTVNPYINDGFIDWIFLNSILPVFEDEHVRHIRFYKPLKVIIDGKKNIGVVLKP